MRRARLVNETGSVGRAATGTGHGEPVAATL